MGEASYTQTSFLGGEWSPFFQGRTDHPKYKTALDLSRNGFPLEEGAWVRRPGSRLKAQTYKNKPARIYPVEFTTSEPYDVEFTDGWLRLFQGHQPVFTTDGPQTVTAISTANPAQITLSAIVTWATGDEIYFQFGPGTPTGGLPLRNRSFTVTKIDTQHFTLTDTITGATINGSTLALAGGFTLTASRVLRLPTPYVNGNWATNRIIQNQDLGVVLNNKYIPYLLEITEGTIAQTASAIFEPIIFQDGPYLDPITDTAGTTSILTWTGGTYAGPPLADGGGNLPSPVPIGGTCGCLTANALTDGTEVFLAAYFVYTGHGDPQIGAPYLGPTASNCSPGYWTNRENQGWAPVDPNGVGAQVTGTITITAQFQAWKATTNYQPGNYVTDGGVSYKAILASTGIEPGIAGGWATYWQIVDSGIAVTGDGNTPVGFQTTDVGRMVRLWSQPPVWDPRILYQPGVMVSYQGSAYAMTGANTFGGDVRAGLNPATTFTAPQWGTLMQQQAINSDPNWQTDVLGTDVQLRPGWAPVGPAGQWSWGRITQVLASNQAVVTLDADSAPITCPAGNPPITIWRMGLWSDTTNYPASGSFYEGRFWFGGAVKNRFDTTKTFGWKKDSDIVDMSPTLTSGDQVNGFTSDGTVTDDCGISYTLESKDANEIVWFEPDRNGLLVGTAGGEWLIEASTLSDPITPTSIQCKRVTKYGCADIEPRRTGISLVFIQKFRRRVMEFLADVFTGKYIAPHLNETAKHLSSPGIAEIGYQEELAPILWARTGPSTLTESTTQQVILSSPTWDPHYTSTLATLTNNNLTITDSYTNYNGIGVAVDLTNMLIWFFNPWSGTWNETTLGSADPARGIGGWAINPAMAGATIFPCVSLANNVVNNVITANFGGSPFKLQPQSTSPPAGFAPWGSGVTWNPSDMAPSGIALSNGNLTATGTTNYVVGHNSVRATVGQTSGKWYFEISLDVQSGNGTFIGLATSAFTLADPIGFPFSCGISNDGDAWLLPTSFHTGWLYDQQINAGVVGRTTLGTVGHASGKYYFEVRVNKLASNGGYLIGIGNHILSLSSQSGGGIFLGQDMNGVGADPNAGVVFNNVILANFDVLSAGDWVGVAVDLDNKKIWYWNGTQARWNHDILANQNPVGAVGGALFTTMPLPAYPAGSVLNWADSNELTLNCGQSPFQFTVPTGFLAWATAVVTTITTPTFVTSPGGLIGATYRRVSAFTTEVPAFVGWHRHDLGHGRGITSIAVGPSGDGTLDNIDMVTTDGTNYYVEGCTQIFDEDDVLTDGWFVDGGLVPDSVYQDTVSSVTGIRFTGLWPLVGKTVTVMAFGLDLGDFTVDSNGTVFVPYGSGIQPTTIDYTKPGAGAYLFTAAYITANLLPVPGRNGAPNYASGYMPCVVGSTFTSQGQLLRPTAPEVSGARSGPATFKKRRNHLFGGLFHNTIGVQVGTDFANNILPCQFKDDGDNLYLPNQMFSGVWRDTILSDYNFDGMVTWQILRPYPASLVSIGAMLKTQDV